jgi:hypothetical protein
MHPQLRSFRKVEDGLVRAVVARARARIQKGETIHLLAVRRNGDDDGRLSFTVVVDPRIEGCKLAYEPRADELWDCKDAPVGVAKIIETLSREHEKEDADDFPGFALTPPQALFTFMLDRVAERLQAELSLPVKLMRTEGTPIYDLERGELRYWVEETD